VIPQSGGFGEHPARRFAANGDNSVTIDAGGDKPADGRSAPATLTAMRCDPDRWRGPADGRRL
jgi:hypothetical protein